LTSPHGLEQARFFRGGTCHSPKIYKKHFLAGSKIPFSLCEEADVKISRCPSLCGQRLEMEGEINF